MRLYMLLGSVALILVIVGVVFLVRYLKRRREERLAGGFAEGAVADEDEIYPIPITELAAIEEQEEEEEVEGIEMPLEPLPSDEQLPSPEEIQRKQNFNKVRDIASEKPDEAAALVRAWLTDE